MITEYATEHDLKILLFDNPNYESAILGISDDNRVIYDYELMVEYLIEQDNMTVDDAIDFIEYNTIRALRYMDINIRPIILNSLD